MKFSVHLTFDGQCEAAFQFYERCFGGRIETMLSYGDSPMAGQAPPEWREKILHATLAIGDRSLAGADPLPRDYRPSSGFSVLIDIDDPAEAERIFGELSTGGSVHLPMQETFWAARFGVLVDRFGVPWEINCGRAEAEAAAAPSPRPGTRSA